MDTGACCSRGIYVGSKPQPKVDETYVVFNVLRRFDDLNFFESTIGENSAQDILDIIKGKK